MKPPKINVSLAAASPEYAALAKKRDELLQRKEELRARGLGVVERIGRGRRTGSVYALAGSQPGVARPGVTALLGAFADRLAPPEKVQGEEPTDLDHLRRIEAETADVEQALSFVAAGLRTSRVPASEKVCAAVGPEYARRARAFCEALCEAIQRAAEYEELRDALQAENVAWAHLGPLPEPPFGDPHYAPQSLVDFLAAAIECGHLDRRAVPAVIKL